jgi:membrane protein YdbS with pleckstrin-like domain
MSANEQVAWIAKLQLTVYMVQLIGNPIKTTHFQLLCNSIIIAAMMTSLIVIHLLKYDVWHYEDFWT